MATIRLPIPYTVHVKTSRNGKDKHDTVAACEIGEFSIPEHDVEDLMIVGSWHQVWGVENYIGRDKLFDAEPGEWKKQFQAEPALTRLVLIDGKFYSPLKAAPRDGAASFLLTDANLNSMLVMSDVYQGLSCSGYALSYFERGNPFRKNLVASDYLQNPGKPVSPSHKGKTRTHDTLGQVREHMTNLFGSLSVVDGMIWGEIDEPVLCLHQTREGVKLSIGMHGSWSGSDSVMYFSLNDYSIAKCIIDEHFSNGKVEIEVEYLKIDLPEALRPSMEYDEVVRAVRRFRDLTKSSLSTYTKDTGRLWFEMNELLQAAELPEKIVEDVVSKVDIMAARLPDEKVKDHDEASRAVRLAKLTVDRWNLRPVDAKPAMGM